MSPIRSPWSTPRRGDWPLVEKRTSFMTVASRGKCDGIIALFARAVRAASRPRPWPFREYPFMPRRVFVGMTRTYGPTWRVGALRRGHEVPENLVGQPMVAGGQ